MNLLRMWHPSDKREKPRLVEVLYWIQRRDVTVGVAVIEAEKEFPGVAFVHPLELRVIRER